LRYTRDPPKQISRSAMQRKKKTNNYVIPRDSTTVPRRKEILSDKIAQPQRSTTANQRRSQGKKNNKILLQIT